MGYVTTLTRSDLMDDVVPATDDRAAETARPGSSGFGALLVRANVYSGLRVAERHGPGKWVVTIMYDSGLWYLSGGLYTTD